MAAAGFETVRGGTFLVQPERNAPRTLRAVRSERGVWGGCTAGVSAPALGLRDRPCVRAALPRWARRGAGWGGSQPVGAGAEGLDGWGGSQPVGADVEGLEGRRVGFGVPSLFRRRRLRLG